ncbi:MAG TPA: CPBP family intramembrane glutamic endopeptidase [Candidatus Sulfotelmatobacter sp.]|nr:CPBP family intramembrane glutamic endopeptidase [Candidatus Sulfotelmatobacter sp.]
MSNVTPLEAVVLAIELLPALAFGLATEKVQRWITSWPVPVRIAAPAMLVLPYTILAGWFHLIRWDWLALYTLLPVAMAWLMLRAASADPEQRGNWRDAVILLTLGLAVDLRWFDVAWPTGLRGWGNLLLVDAGLYAFLGIRQLSGTGFDFHFRWSDWKTGFRELLFFAPAVIVLGLVLGFIHPHASIPNVFKALVGWAGIFVFVAVPEELFFRTWVQNLLERRLGRTAALVTASILFGLSHFNKRNFGSAHFNWRYVLLAAIAGIFYGRAWRENRRITASGITHTCVDWLWYLWF